MFLKHAAYRTVSRACRALGVPPRPAAGQRVLLFHAVGSEIPGDPYGLSLPPERFAAFLDRLVELADWRPAPFGAASSERLEAAIVFDDGFRDTLTAAAPLLAERGLPFTVFVTAGFIRDRSPLHLSIEQLKELAALPGATIGAHGLEHAHLTRLGDAALAAELMDSRKFLEDAIGKPVVSMSYPHGDVDQRVAKAAKGAGYLLGGTSRYGLNGAGRDPMLLCRTELTGFDGVEDFELKLRGHWDWYRFRHPDPAS